MRGYNRNKADLQPYPTVTRSREQIAADIAAGNPSPVTYRAVSGKLPPQLVRSEPRK